MSYDGASVGGGRVGHGQLQVRKQRVLPHVGQTRKAHAKKPNRTDLARVQK